ncbi:16S rRNA (guanine(966)-N(2))-methyltransferase RsmD [Tomitella biformata]|uniref:16S rRNA (guanine(966)-N(2))-methyltransferase RsmD n=1 Tax=Tomitella biformata TaxID=630403 RepID=UPI0004661C30|nr:16S rRNA (guanine(966)-N(2))-methyltransferase RsmD [Tomitella biformata]
MTRIIAGAAKGRRLAVPPAGTRPTSDRVREAVFSALGSRMDFDEARVLDLFAGSGGLALEALSRGAAQAVLVEANAKAADIARANIATAALRGARVHRGRVQALLDAGADGHYDLVFADPPYDIAEEDVTAMLAALCQHGWLAADALVVLERSTRCPETSWPAEIDDVQVKRYGETRVEFGRAE